MSIILALIIGIIIAQFSFTLALILSNEDQDVSTKVGGGLILYIVQFVINSYKALNFLWQTRDSKIYRKYISSEELIGEVGLILISNRLTSKFNFDNTKEYFLREHYGDKEKLLNDFYFHHVKCVKKEKDITEDLRNFLK